MGNNVLVINNVLGIVITLIAAAVFVVAIFKKLKLQFLDHSPQLPITNGELHI